MTELVAPQKPDIERALLGTLLVYPDATVVAREWLEPEDFFDARNQEIFRGVMELRQKNALVDFTTVRQYLLDSKRFLDDGLLYLADLATSHAGSHVMVPAYAAQIKECAQQRELLQLGAELQKAASNGMPLEEIAPHFHLRLLQVGALGKDAAFTVMAEVMCEVTNAVDEAKTSSRRWAGLDTGFECINDKLNGLCAAELTVIGARPSIGKTTLCLQIAMAAAEREGVGVGIFSLEMSRRQLGQRMVSIKGEINLFRLRRGQLTEDEWMDYARVVGSLAQLPIYIDDTSGLHVDQARGRMERLARRHDIGLWIFDHLHLMRGTGGSENESLNYVSRGLKNLSRDFDVPVVALSQLNREVESRPDRRPRLSDLRASGGIEQDADNVLLIHRPGFYQDLLKASRDPEGLARSVEISAEKTRFGMTGVVDLVWLPERACFANQEWMTRAH